MRSDRFTTLALALFGVGVCGSMQHAWAQPLQQSGAKPTSAAPDPDALVLARQVNDWLWPHDEPSAFLLAFDQRIDFRLDQQVLNHPELAKLAQTQRLQLAELIKSNYRLNFEALAKARAQALAKAFSPEELQQIIDFRRQGLVKIFCDAPSPPEATKACGRRN